MFPIKVRNVQAYTANRMFYLKPEGERLDIPALLGADMMYTVDPTSDTPFTVDHIGNSIYVTATPNTTAEQRTGQINIRLGSAYRKLH